MSNAEKTWPLLLLFFLDLSSLFFSKIHLIFLTYTFVVHPIRLNRKRSAYKPAPRLYLAVVAYLTLVIELIEKNFAAIIGVIGTLLGVLLGSFINWISRIGKIKIFQNSIVIDLLEKDGYGGFKTVQDVSSETEALDIKIDIDILNTSEYSKKSMRNLGLLIKQRKKEKVYTMKDIQPQG